MVGPGGRLLLKKLEGQGRKHNINSSCYSVESVPEPEPDALVSNYLRRISMRGFVIGNLVFLSTLGKIIRRQGPCQGLSFF